MSQLGRFETPILISGRLLFELINADPGWPNQVSRQLATIWRVLLRPPRQTRRA
jgi:hypothetical protein